MHTHRTLTSLAAALFAIPSTLATIVTVSAPAHAGIAPRLAHAAAVTKASSRSGLAAGLAISGPVTLQYTAVTSETDSCIGNCIEGGFSGADFSAYSRTASGTLQSTVTFTVSNGVTTPKKAVLNETADTYNAQGTFTHDALGGQCGFVDGSGTEVAQGGTRPGSFVVHALNVITDGAGQTDLELFYGDPYNDIYSDVGTAENTSVTLNTKPCNIGTFPAGEEEATEDASTVGQALGLIKNQPIPACHYSCFDITGWTINPNWTPETGGTLAAKTLSGSAPQPFGPDTGTVNATQTWTLTTPSCARAKVQFPHIRAKDTPGGMPDRIPPRVNTEITLNLNKPIPTCQTVALSVQGGSNDGSILINGGSSYTLPTDTAPLPVTLTGQSMTAIGDGAHLRLIATDETDPSQPLVIARSKPFAVSAIPIKYMDRFKSLDTTPGELGIVVADSWRSDSGQIADLSGIQMAEVVQHVDGNNGNTSGLLPGTVFTKDTHSTPLADIPSSPGVFDIADQTVGFIDERATTATPASFTAADFFPMRKSGYTIVRSVGQDTSGNLTFTISKTGANVTTTATISGTPVTVTISATAGGTFPASGIVKTQPIP